MTATATATLDATRPRNLTAMDRCDTGDCSAAAKWLVVFPGQSELIFCAHHGRKNEDALSTVGATVHKDDIEP